MSQAEELEESIWRNRAFRSYIVASSATVFAFSMQQLLISWLLIGVLDTPADRVGLSQALVGIPGLFIMLWGGAAADRVDPRGLLIRVYAVTPLVPLLLIGIDGSGYLNFWTVTFWALLMSVANSFSNPAQAAILNRSSGRRVQEGVTASTAVMLVVQVIGLSLAGQLERVGLATVMIAQAAAIAVGCLAVRRISAVPSPAGGPRVAAWRSVIDGLQAIHRNRVVADVLGLNFVSMMFNVGSFMLVLPFMITKLYDGDAAYLGGILVLFFSGGAISNFVLLRFMPITHPGRFFLTMQLTRALIYVILWFQPPEWLLIGAIFLWGMNMGVTNTASRAIVQEAADESYRARMLSVYNVGVIGAQPVGALFLGQLITWVGIVNALLPGLVVSVLLFAYGILFTPVWSFRSRQARLPGA